MELKKRVEIRRMMKDLPGYYGGFGGNLFQGAEEYRNTGWIGAMPGESVLTINTDYSPQLRQPYIKTPKAAQSTFAERGGDIITSGIGFAGSAINAFGPVKGVNELQSDAGMSYAAGNGFGYTQQNNIDYNQQMSELSKQNTSNTLNAMGTGAAFGATVGSIIPGLGTVAGGLIGGVLGAFTGIFGGSSRKERLRRKMIAAQQQIDRTNNFSRSSAHSDYLAQQYAYDHTNTQDDVLYGAAGGKDMYSLLPSAMEMSGVYTSGGITNGVANSRVAYGETIYNPEEGTANVVKTGTLDKDTNFSYLKPTDVVFGNHVDWNTGMKFRDEALPFAAVLEKLNKK